MLEVRQLPLAEHLVDHQIDQFHLAPHMPVQRHHPGPQPLGNPPHRNRIRALQIPKRWS
ncbi:hypothetical protein PWY87_02905 [Kribbella solani]|uniref:hypothetical protein n=1 Tax=Kribbella solani TaxID=236067 RepID=UPI0029B193BE|nr:hypothetical protein [Kribbella solani]MDX2972961.1 hypothetical protein [Kribbella solani]MDX3000605.1 hypothetical protein [Kribbella solani]